MATDAPRAADRLHQVIALAESGRHDEAVLLAAAGRAEATESYGERSDEAVLWAEAEAHTAYLGQDPLRSCTAWISVAAARLARGEEPDSAEVEAAVDRAHHQWQRLPASKDGIRLAVELMSLRHRVPGRRPGAGAAIRRRLVAAAV